MNVKSCVFLAAFKILFASDFWQFDYHVSRCRSLWVYPTWDLLIFLKIVVSTLKSDLRRFQPLFPLRVLPLPSCFFHYAVLTCWTVPTGRGLSFILLSASSSDQSISVDRQIANSVLQVFCFFRSALERPQWILHFCCWHFVVHVVLFSVSLFSSSMWWDVALMLSFCSSDVFPLFLCA